MPKRDLTPGYIFFYLLFLPDTWQILLAFITAVLVTPRILTPDVGAVGSAIVHVMVAGNVYVITTPIGKRISAWLRRAILKRQGPR